MIDFGYTLNPSSRINLDNFDRNKFEKLSKSEPDVLLCIGCGSCTASCTAGKYTDTSLRKAILSILDCNEKAAVDFAASCLLCGKCTLVCPRSINTRNLLLSITKIYGKKQ
ncbi:MAG: 4Fe-4S dicluster domain-containing protein [Bacteroidales bacterium]|jgi:heterodisulfide reductase subunit C|nr:4Fe-4S dicluster domain-containing protein [Bacteroidales bacterium]